MKTSYENKAFRENKEQLKLVFMKTRENKP